VECVRFVDSIAEHETSKSSMHREWIPWCGHRGGALQQRWMMKETVCGREILAVRFLAAEKRPRLKKLDWLQIKCSLEKASPLPCMLHDRVDTPLTNNVVMMAVQQVGECFTTMHVDPVGGSFFSHKG
jgi:hypothetical protein